MANNDMKGMTLVRMIRDDLNEAIERGITLRETVCAFGAVLEVLLESLPKTEREAAWELLSGALERRLEKLP